MERGFLGILLHRDPGGTAAADGLGGLLFRQAVERDHRQGAFDDAGLVQPGDRLRLRGADRPRQVHRGGDPEGWFQPHGLRHHRRRAGALAALHDQHRRGRPERAAGRLLLLADRHVRRAGAALRLHQLRDHLGGSEYPHRHLGQGDLRLLREDPDPGPGAGRREPRGQDQPRAVQDHDLPGVQDDGQGDLRPGQPDERPGALGRPAAERQRGRDGDVGARSAERARAAEDRPGARTADGHGRGGGRLRAGLEPAAEGRDPASDRLCRPGSDRRGRCGAEPRQAACRLCGKLLFEGAEPDPGRDRWRHGRERRRRAGRRPDRAARSAGARRARPRPRPHRAIRRGRAVRGSGDPHAAMGDRRRPGRLDRPAGPERPAGQRRLPGRHPGLSGGQQPAGADPGRCDRGLPGRPDRIRLLAAAGQERGTGNGGVLPRRTAASPERARLQRLDRLRLRFRQGQLQHLGLPATAPDLLRRSEGADRGGGRGGRHGRRRACAGRPLDRAIRVRRLFRDDRAADRAGAARRAEQLQAADRGRGRPDRRRHRRQDQPTDAARFGRRGPDPALHPGRALFGQQDAAPQPGGQRPADDLGNDLADRRGPELRRSGRAARLRRGVRRRCASRDERRRCPDHRARHRGHRQRRDIRHARGGQPDADCRRAELRHGGGVAGRGAVAAVSQDPAGAAIDPRYPGFRPQDRPVRHAAERGPALCARDRCAGGSGERNHRRSLRAERQGTEPERAAPDTVQSRRSDRRDGAHARSAERGRHGVALLPARAAAADRFRLRRQADPRRQGALQEGCFQLS